MVQRAVLHLQPGVTWGRHDGDNPTLLPVTMRLLGAHQGANAATAAVAASVVSQRGLGEVGAAAVIEGLAAATLPGRCQVDLTGCDCMHHV